MKLSRRTFTAAALAGLAHASLACSGGPGAPKLADVKAGSMPSGADWTGVYFSQYLGNIHIITQGSTISGKWQRPVKDRWAEFHGEADGNLLRFTWTEYTVGAIGPNSTHTGKGYFLYTRPEGANVDDVVDGQIGQDKDEVGDEIHGVKQRNVNPDLDSIGGTGATDIGGGDWDKNHEGGDAEKPAPPPP
jgi:hypothetical protein